MPGHWAGLSSPGPRHRTHTHLKICTQMWNETSATNGLRGVLHFQKAWSLNLKMKQAKGYLAANNVILPPILHPTLFVCISCHHEICQCDGHFDLLAPVLKSQDVISALWYPAVSHQCDPGICCGNPADFGSWSEQSEDWFQCWRNLQAEGQRQNQAKSNVLLPGWNFAVSLPSVAMMMMFWVSLKLYSALFSLKKLITSLTRCSAAWRLVPVLRPWPADKYMESWNLESEEKNDFYRCPLCECRRNKHGPTMIVKFHQIPDDIICASTYFRVSDVHYIFSFTSEGQHMELQLDFIAVQLERR